MLEPLSSDEMTHSLHSFIVADMIVARGIAFVYGRHDTVRTLNILLMWSMTAWSSLYSIYMRMGCI